MVEEVRSHYKQAWPPMIHAIALWLTNVAFKHFEDTVIGAGNVIVSTVMFLLRKRTPVRTPTKISNTCICYVKVRVILAASLLVSLIIQRWFKHYFFVNPITVIPVSHF